ncbi:MAG: DUF1835 domain-containing protein [Cyclobacteriaceae bacterium]
MKSEIYHILNGDALRDQFPNIRGELIVAKECLVDGDVQGDTHTEFWETRSRYLKSVYGTTRDVYYSKTVSEFEKILEIKNSSQVNLWFERDLFCQVNLWFCCWLLKDKKIESYLVSPKHMAGWNGFGGMNSEELKMAFTDKLRLSDNDVLLFSDCWLAYQNNDNEKLAGLSNSDRFPYLEEVVHAHNQRIDNGNAGRPERVLRDIMEEKNTIDFNIIFPEFNRREGIYGFSDLQVKRILDKIIAT